MHGWSLALTAAVIGGYALVSRRLAGTVVTAAMVFLSAGFLLGEQGLGWIEVTFGEGGVRALAEATLVVVLFADASRIDLRTLRREVQLPARLLGVGLPLTIVAGALAAAVVMPELSLGEVLVVAVVLAPTDAALGQAVVTDPNLPSRVRQGLNVESGLNDGLCVPLLTMAIALAGAEAGSVGDMQAARLVGEAIGWGVAGGIGAGLVGALAARGARARGWVDEEWAGVVPLVTAASAYAAATALGGSGFIAAFVGGVTFGWLLPGGPELVRLGEQVGSVLNGATFIVFGAVVLGALWSSIGLTEVVYAVLSLTVVRMVPVALALLGTKARWPTIGFLGWFGPRGLASIVFAVVVVESSELPHVGTIVAVVVTTVALSVVAHGLSAAPAARRYASWYRLHPTPMEDVEVPDQRWRLHHP